MVKPRVCIISHVYLEERYQGKLNYLAQHVDLTVISPDAFQSAYRMQRAVFPRERVYDIRTYSVFYPLGIRTSTRWMLASMDLGFRESPPNIIHVENEAHSFSLLQALIYRRLYTPQARIVLSFWANQKISGLKGAFLDLLTWVMRPDISFYIAGSTDGMKLLVEDRISPKRVVTFPLDGVDMNYYSPALEGELPKIRTKLSFSFDEFVIGFVGRFVLEKGICDLLAAFQKLRERVVGRRVRLLCVGDGPLKSMLLYQPEVVVASPGNASGVLDYYRIMDVLVLPSRTTPMWKEQFGRVLSEAMAVGIPVIGSSSGAIPEVIGDAGVIFNEGDVHALEQQLLAILSNPEISHELRRRGQRRVANNYSDRCIAEKTLAVYGSLL